MNRRERRSKARLCMAEASPGPLQIRASVPPASSRHLHDSEHLRVASIANREQQGTCENPQPWLPLRRTPRVPRTPQPLCRLPRIAHVHIASSSPATSRRVWPPVQPAADCHQAPNICKQGGVTEVT